MLIKEKSFYRTFFSLWGALVVQNIIVHSVNLADNIMIGAYGENALAGVAAVNQIQFVLGSAPHRTDQTVFFHRSAAGTGLCTDHVYARQRFPRGCAAALYHRG